MKVYMIRKIGTDSYYHAYPDFWTSLEHGHNWWHNEGLKKAFVTFERLRELGIKCGIVKFKVEEMLEKVMRVYMIRSSRGYYSEFGVRFWHEQRGGKLWTDFDDVRNAHIRIKQQWIREQIDIVAFNLVEAKELS